MSLADFDKAEGQEGWRYELSRGVVSVLAIRWFPHIALLDEVQKQLYGYRLGDPESPLMIGSGGHCKLLVRAFESERQPDVTVYRKPPLVKDDPWDVWVPQVVVEVVDEETRHVDLVLKPEEYMAFGVAEYFAVDAAENRVLVFEAGASGGPTAFRSEDRFSSRALPGFVLDVGRVLGAPARYHARPAKR